MANICRLPIIFDAPISAVTGILVVLTWQPAETGGTP